MKLLNCSTLRIEDMHPARKQKLEEQGVSTAYAILSHRWESDEDEVTFEDIASADMRTKNLLGWSKIEKTCTEALRIGIAYAWIDTCCVDKRNLTELTEAINSMFKWYAEAEICFAYLSDVDSGGDLTKSVWFTRGWILQELIAPGRMEFYDKHWSTIGSRVDLSQQIQLRTSINAEILRHDSSTRRSIQSLLAGIPVGRRMSWAADRRAKKEEDRAYSLLGIFGVSMPLLYGEGDRGFLRLQEEIIKETNDMSLFAWCDSTVTSPDGSAEFRGILTTTPDHLRDCRDLTSLSDLRRGPEFSMTNMGRPLEKKILFISKQFTADLLEETVRIPGRDFRFSFDTEKPKLIVRVISQAASRAYWDPDTYRFVSRRLWEFEGSEGRSRLRIRHTQRGGRDWMVFQSQDLISLVPAKDSDATRSDPGRM
ncbi:HET domain-containing protein [Colletotrichum paranaense]|uniref:HET domain-containing protein n=1 Tax=Colletotrichum paranaense TaxID=1914294 RepID=A0ABQ9SBN4_9PEZI|nr:HET domain-containing protein [Colletotrichum paranaense]KAK1531758.1 HET domain-containing protein [Colletotrichum paranaense]